MEIRTDRLGVLIEQLTESAELSRARCDSLADDHYLWEPLDGMWSLRPRAEVVTTDAFGAGAWVLDREPVDPFAPGPVTTIAWRMNHLIHLFAARYEWSFGYRRTDPASVVEFTPVASEALTMLWTEVERWANALGTLTADQLDDVGFGQYPWGLDSELPFIGIVRWVNREFIHHMAEVALLQDLFERREELLAGRPHRDLS